MKKRLFIMISSATFLASNAYGVDYNFVGEFTKECTHTRVDFYLSSNGEYTIYPADIGGGYDTLYFIRNTESYVDIWQREKGIIKNGTCNKWWRISNVVPPNIEDVLLIGGTKCTFVTPKNVSRNTPDVQIVYHIFYKEEVGKDKGNSHYYYYKYGKDKPTLLNSQVKRKWSQVKEFMPACYDIYLHTNHNGNNLDSSEE